MLDRDYIVVEFATTKIKTTKGFIDIPDDSKIIKIIGKMKFPASSKTQKIEFNGFIMSQHGEYNLVDVSKAKMYVNGKAININSLIRQL